MLTSPVCIEECTISTHWMALDGGTAWREITFHISDYVPLSINLPQPQKSSAIMFYILVQKHFYLAPAYHESLVNSSYCMTWQNLENDVIIVSVAQLYGITVKTSSNGRETINFVCSTQDPTFENPKLQQPPTVWKNLGISRVINKTINNICITISSSSSPPPSHELLKLFNSQQPAIN